MRCSRVVCLQPNLPGWNRYTPPSPDGSRTMRDSEVARYLEVHMRECGSARMSKQQDTIGKRRLAHRLREALNNLRWEGHEVGPATYAKALNLAAKLAHDKLASSLLEDMKLRCIPVRHGAYISLLSCMARSGKTEEGMRIFESFLANHNELSIEICTAMLAVARSNRKLREEVLQAIRGAGLKPTPETYALLVRYSSTVSEGVHWIETMTRKGESITKEVLTALLAVAAQPTNPDPAGAEKVFALIARLAPPDVVAWTSLMGVYAAAGELKGAAQVFVRMCEDGATPSAVTYATFLKAVVKSPGLSPMTLDRILLANAVWEEAQGEYHASLHVHTRLMEVFVQTGNKKGAILLRNYFTAKGVKWTQVLAQHLNHLRHAPRHSNCPLPSLLMPGQGCSTSSLLHVARSFSG